MDLGITGKSAFVAASTSGLGRASAAALAADGARVGINGRTAASVDEAVAALPGSIAIPGDITDSDGRAGVIEAIGRELGGVDILVLNGPGPVPGLAADFTVELARDASDRLLVPHVDLVRAFLPGMRERGWGRIVLIGSSAVQAPSPNLVGSSAGRSAVAAYLKTLAAEVAADGVTVNAVLPGRIRTPRIE
ncbi:MAG: SDR family NAD(P)-dependent oxidoreductase, partial [bacterium]|nr:SDR family NAD(P)-dependent oxidoreductase [bacterium]